MAPATRRTTVILPPVVTYTIAKKSEVSYQFANFIVSYYSTDGQDVIIRLRNMANGKLYTKTYKHDSIYTIVIDYKDISASHSILCKFNGAFS